MDAKEKKTSFAYSLCTRMTSPYETYTVTRTCSQLGEH